MRNGRSVRLGVSFAAGLWVAVHPAYSTDDAARRDAAALRQGSTVISVAQLEDALAHVPEFQLSAFGPNEDAIRRTFAERHFIDDLVLARGAEKAGIKNDAWVRLKLKQVAANAARRKTQPRVVSEDDVRAYYTDHTSEFVHDERILVWRILVASKEDATTLLKSLKADGTVKAFTEAARDKSLDKASYLRSGNLGFLLPDGTSVDAKLKMDPALVQAARTVKDGEFVPTVVQEGEAFAIVWRRGSTAREVQTLAQAAPSIREKLERIAREKADRELIERLRKERVRDVDPAGLAGFEVDLGSGSIFVKK